MSCETPYWILTQQAICYRKLHEIEAFFCLLLNSLYCAHAATLKTLPKLRITPGLFGHGWEASCCGHTVAVPLHVCMTSPASKLPLATLFDQGEQKQFVLMLSVQTVIQVHHIYLEIWILDIQNDKVISIKGKTEMIAETGIITYDYLISAVNVY